METIEELRRIIKAGENDITEFKASFNQEVLVSLNAFANTKGGCVYIGISDNQKITGVDVQTETVKNWVNEIKQKTEPSIIPDVTEYLVDGKNVIVLSIKEYPVKPVNLLGRYYKRIKNSNHRLQLSEISDFYLNTFNSSWDYYLDNEHSIDDLSAEKIDKLIDTINHVQKRSTIENDTMRFLMKYELVRNGKPTHAAFLLFMSNESVLSGIQAGRFKSKTMIIDSISIAGDLFQEVETILDFIRKHLMVEYIITGNAQREERFNYPLEAIREIVINMIVHRKYQDSGDSIIKIFDDRIEFFNPGNLPDGLTVEQLLTDNYSPKSRNMLINKMFKEAAIVEKYGSGISRIIEACRKHGKCSVSFANEQHGFKVILSEKKLTQPYENRPPLEINEPIFILYKDNYEPVNVPDEDIYKPVNVPNEDIYEPVNVPNEDIYEPVNVPNRDTHDLVNVPNRDIHDLVNDRENTRNSSINILENKIIELILRNRKITLSDLAQQSKTDITTIKRNITKLKERKLLKRIGPDKGGYWEILTPKDTTNTDKQNINDKAQTTTKALDTRHEKIIKLIIENPRITIFDIAQECSVDAKTIKRDLAKLKETNLIRRIGSNKAGYWEIIK